MWAASCSYVKSPGYEADLPYVPQNLPDESDFGSLFFLIREDFNPAFPKLRKKKHSVLRSCGVCLIVIWYIDINGR